MLGRDEKTQLTCCCCSKPLKKKKKIPSLPLSSIQHPPLLMFLLILGEIIDFFGLCLVRQVTKKVL